ncbi:MAG TPA: phosphotransferase [Kofleriaceae bacterium]|nr:phosphotransferase [Kofleriaceae bacterium]
MTLQERVDALLRDPYDARLARSILGTVNSREICARVEAFVGVPIDACMFVSLSIGAVFGLVLEDGARVVVKVHAFEPSREAGFPDLAALDAVYAAQAELHAVGVPCAAVVQMPVPFGSGAAAVMAYLEPHAPDPPHHAGVRRALAALAAQIVEQGRSLVSRMRLPRRGLSPDLYPAPHNALFDFTTPDGGWIDDRARAARQVLDRPRHVTSVVAHGDLSCANVIVSGGRVTNVFDVDSVCWLDELRHVASAAVYFTYTGEAGWTWPSRDDARAFVEDYAAARAWTPTLADREVMNAYAIYALAYTARCAGATSTIAQTLASAADDYLFPRSP